MIMKRTLFLAVALTFMASFALSADPPQAQSPATVMFAPGDFYLGPQVSRVDTGGGGKVGVGGNVEYFVTKAVAVGGDVSVYFQSPGALSLFPDVEYHFDVKVKSLDVFVGAGPSVSFGFGSDGQTLFGGKGYAAARYFFSPGIGGFLKFGVTGDKRGATIFWSAGVSFKL